jgi:hypothetical protein
MDRQCGRKRLKSDFFRLFTQVRVLPPKLMIVSRSNPEKTENSLEV